jgi:hypothetical protein
MFTKGPVQTSPSCNVPSFHEGGFDSRIEEVCFIIISYVSEGILQLHQMIRLISYMTVTSSAVDINATTRIVIICWFSVVVWCN